MLAVANALVSVLLFLTDFDAAFVLAQELPKASRVCKAGQEEEEEEKDVYKLQPANKTDHLCQSWQ